MTATNGINHEGAWNPHYSAFAASHGRTEEAQRAHDRKRYPAAPALPFLIWMNDVKRTFIQTHPEAVGKHSVINDNAAFTAFVIAKALKGSTND